MQELTKTLHELEGLHEKLFGSPAPKLPKSSFFPFPPGVDPVEHARSEVQHLRRLSEELRFAPRPGAWVPPADSFLGEGSLTVRIDLSGVSREDLEVHVVGRECIVTGDRKPPRYKPGMRPMALECPWGTFERRFVLPMGSQVEAMTARCVDGVLELNVPIETARLDVEKRAIEVG